MESPLQTKSIGMISHEETIAGSDLSSTCPTLSDVNEDMEYQIDFIDQGFKWNLNNGNKMEESDSNV